MNADNRRCVVKVKSEQTKNHTGATNENDGHKCLSKRNKKSGALFQYPKCTFTDDEEEWYENRAMGKNAIGNFMSVLSKKANLYRKNTPIIVFTQQLLQN